MHTIYRSLALLLLALPLSLTAQAQPVGPTPQRTAVPLAERASVLASITGVAVPCEDGLADTFPCENVELLAFLAIPDLGGEVTVVDGQTYATSLNDIWGWTDPETGREYALVGRTDGTAFVDVSSPTSPVYLGELPFHGPLPFYGVRGSVWRDVKVYQDYAYVVADGVGEHGMQVFDLKQLRDVQGAPAAFSETAHYDRIGNAHNIVINEETGFAYAVGAGGQNNPCGPGLHMINIQDPAQPAFAGCFSQEGTGRGSTGYTHDAQCVIYRGPDVEHQGKEICFGANETALLVADVTDKDNPVAISSAGYPDVGYVHQGWLSEDQRYFFQDDELDETNGLVATTRTVIWDVQDLDDPQVDDQYFATTNSIDHNQYTVGDYLFQANYTSGLRVLDVRDPVNPVPVGFFDTYPAGDPADFSGAWSVYPYFPSGNVVVSSIDEGLFVLRPTNVNVTTATEEEVDLPEAFRLLPAHPNPFNPQTSLTLALGAPQRATVAVYDLLGREVRRLHEGALAAGEHHFSFDGAGLPSGLYLVRAVGEAHQDVQTVTLVK